MKTQTINQNYASSNGIYRKLSKMRRGGQLTFFVVCMVITTVRGAITVKFLNENLDYSTNNIYVLFTEQPGAPDPFDATFSGQPLSLTTSYSFAQLGNGISLSHLWGGVVYISLGQAMTDNRIDQPSFLNTSDPDYYKRWDRFEITYNGQPYDVADLTGINSFAIPLSIKTFGDGGTTQRAALGYTVNGGEMINLLKATATNDSAVLKDASNNFLRVIGPTTYTTPSIGPYPPFDDYVNSVISSGEPILIQDLYSGPGPEPRKTTQTYTFTNTFDVGSNLVMNGGGTVIGMGHSVIISNDILAYNIYANNPPYFVDGTNASFADNDIYSAVVRDTLAGFAIGYVGSTVTDPVTGQPFKDEYSKFWYATNQPLAFSGVQTNGHYFNKYAEVFWKYSDSYGFPFSDRLHRIWATRPAFCKWVRRGYPFDSTSSKIRGCSPYKPLRGRLFGISAQPPRNRDACLREPGGGSEVASPAFGNKRVRLS